MSETTTITDRHLKCAEELFKPTPDFPIYTGILEEASKVISKHFPEREPVDVVAICAAYQSGKDMSEKGFLQEVANPFDPETHYLYRIAFFAGQKSYSQREPVAWLCEDHDRQGYEFVKTENARKHFEEAGWKITPLYK